MLVWLPVFTLILTPNRSCDKKGRHVKEREPHGHPLRGALRFHPGGDRAAHEQDLRGTATKVKFMQGRKMLVQVCSVHEFVMLGQHPLCRSVCVCVSLSLPLSLMPFCLREHA